MEKVRDLFDKARALLNIYTEEGIQKPVEDYIDLQEKAVPLADLAQKKLYKTGKLFNTFEMYHKPYKNLLGSAPSYKTEDFTGTIVCLPEVVGAKAYSFEADGASTWTIKENQSGTWITIKTVIIPLTVTSLTLYKDILNTIGNNPVRIEITGTTHFRYANVCLFAEPFATGKVPSFRPYFKITMPDNFRSTDQITNESPVNSYSKSANYKWESFKDLYVNYNYEGNIRIIYKPIPITLTSLDDYLEIDDITSQGIVFYMAARLALFKKKEFAQFFEDEFQEWLAESKDTQSSEQKIIDVYGLGGNYGEI